MEEFKQERSWGEHWEQVILHSRKPPASYVHVWHAIVHLEHVCGYNRACSCPSHHASGLPQQTEKCKEV